jgi:hypothetical protein
MELKVTVLLILAAQLWEALKVSILCFSIWRRLLTHTIPNPIILSNNESIGTKSNTEFSSATYITMSHNNPMTCT